MSAYIKHVCAVVNTLARSRSKILDVGCGSGDLMTELLNSGHNVLGYDIADRDSPHPIKKELSHRIKVIRSDEQIPYDTESFHVAVSNMVIEHVFDIEAFYRETMRVLRPGGLAIHTFPAKEILYEWHIHQPLTHWFPNDAWINFWRRLGVGKIGPEWQQHYFAEKTCYRTLRQIKKVFKGASFEYSGNVFLQKLKNYPAYSYPIPVTPIMKWLLAVTMVVRKESGSG